MRLVTSCDQLQARVRGAGWKWIGVVYKNSRGIIWEVCACQGEQRIVVRATDPSSAWLSVAQQIDARAPEHQAVRRRATTGVVEG